MSASASTHSRVARAAGFGAAVGGVYLVLSLLLFTGRGHTVSELPSSAVNTLLLLHLLGGASAGAIVGFVQPWMTTLWRTLAVFIFASVPLAVGVNHIFFPSAELQFKDPRPRIIMLALFFGFLGGMAYWRRWGEQSS